MTTGSVKGKNDHGHSPHQTRNIRRLDLDQIPIHKAFFYGGYEETPNSCRKPMFPDIIDYLRNELASALEKRFQRAQRKPILSVLNDILLQEQRLSDTSESSTADVRLPLIQIPQPARLARQIRKRKKKGDKVFQKCYDLLNDQFGGEMAQKQSKNTIKFRCFWKTTTIYEVLKDRQWVETERSPTADSAYTPLDLVHNSSLSELDWDFFWSDVGWMYEFFDHIHLAEHQRFNHFRNYYELTRKDFLIKNLKRMKKTLEKEDKTEEALKYAFFPQTYALPAEYGLFVEAFKRTPGVWIMKPVGKARGRGIFLFTRLNQISEWKKDHRWKIENPQVENYIVQKYIENPYLVGGKKFDLRIYVLVLSYAPLKQNTKTRIVQITSDFIFLDSIESSYHYFDSTWQKAYVHTDKTQSRQTCENVLESEKVAFNERAYLYRSGFARFSNAHFSMKKEDIANKLVHLTNFSIQKHAPTYNSKTGTKWPLHSLKTYMITKHGEERVNALFHEISSLILRSLVAVQNVIIQDKHCFELYGYDILIDDKLKAWLLEVNASPSLAADTPADHELKYCMLDDVLTLVDMERRLPTPPPVQVGGFDQLVDQGASEAPPKPYNLKSSISLLGCFHDRTKQVRQMTKSQQQHQQQHQAPATATAT